MRLDSAMIAILSPAHRRAALDALAEVRSAERGPPRAARGTGKVGRRKAEAALMLRPWSNAVPTEMDDIRFPSRTEARVWRLLIGLFGRPALRRQVRMPLLAGETATGVPLAITVDFVVVRNGRPILWIDAKTRRRSREWARGAAMFTATWGPICCWDGTGEPPGPVLAAMTGGDR